MRAQKENEKRLASCGGLVDVWSKRVLEKKYG